MNKAKNITYRFTRNAISLLLVGLFMSVSVLRSFHGHQRFALSADNKKSEIVKQADDCKLCDFFSHNLKLLDFNKTAAPEIASPEVIELETAVYSAFYNIPPGNSANRGPPAV